MQYQLEICANSVASAVAAQNGEADRIELCENINEGGTTPSFGTIFQTIKSVNLPVSVLIRPRPGDFLYTDFEFEVMKHDIETCKKLGIQGVVIGILKANGDIDTGRCAELIALARPMQITFHRAFDRCNDLKKGLEDIISMGCERVLTSGGKNVAVNGVQILKELVQQANDRISVMPGSGITEDNIEFIAKTTGAFEFHSTAKTRVTSLMKVLISGDLKTNDSSGGIWVSDSERIRRMKKALTDLRKHI